jgi:hypothetical protein
VSVSPAAGSVDGGVTVVVSLRGTSSTGHSGRRTKRLFGGGFESGRGGAAASVKPACQFGHVLVSGVYDAVGLHKLNSVDR